MRALYLFIILLCVTLYLVLETSLGVRLSLFVLQYTLPGNLTVQHAEGKLLHRIILSNLRYQDETTDINLGKIDIAWDAAFLTSGIVKINSIYAERFIIKTLPSKHNYQAISKNDFQAYMDSFKHISIHEIHINYLSLNSPSISKLDIRTINFIEEKPLEYKMFIDFNPGTINGLISLNNDNGINWQANIAANNINVNYENIILENFQFNLITAGNYHTQLKKFNLLVSNLQGKLNTFPLIGNIDLNYDDQLTINAAQVKLDEANLNIAGSVSNKWHLAYHLDIPQLNKILPLLKGKIKSAGNITGLLNEPMLSAQINLSNINYDVVAIDKLKLNVHGRFTPFTDLHITLDRSNFTIGEYKVESVQGDIFVKNNGSDLSANLANGQFNLPIINLSVKNINIHAISNNTFIKWQGTFKSGNGNATLLGTTSLVINDLYKTHLSFTGTNLSAANLPQFNMSVSPNLTFDYDKDILTTRGKINIPSATIIRFKNSHVVSLPSDVVYANDKKTETTATKFANVIQINLGEKINVDYENLKAQLQGSIHLVQTAGGQPTATGTLNTKNGTYKAYGKNLKIKIGKIIYVGSYILNPGLDIEAIHTINRVGTSKATFINSNYITVGIKVSGTLNQPIISLISNPPMSQNNILSYLLFDTPANNLSVTNSITLMNMATSMSNGGNSTEAISGIQEKLDKLGITFGSTEIYDPSSDTHTSASMLGINKKIGSKITISYQANPFNNLAAFGLHYQLSKYFALRTQASTLETTTDLIFEIETND